MFAFVLGLSWLILTPVCVWLLFGRGHRGLARAAAALTLAGLQGGTLLMGFIEEPPPSVATVPLARPAGSPSPAVSGDAVAATPRPSPSAHSCAVRALAPESVRLSRTGSDVDGMTVYWDAAAHGCGTASVALQPVGRRLRIWLEEGTADRHKGERTLPVTVADGRASLDLPLSPPLRPHTHYVAIDARTGHRIPLKPGTPAPSGT
ncbi:hypothetical protein GCM10023194_65200 [Planotetraspora phitsanulokensis]|uniref:Uncharacterized protein n=1 Tax=Planotetraspora phitsanulokensis TaxID=575192 RepID=A0A8J3UGQ7_9ACTN|nr:hypothetical protein [Planotetraspora phitsanulokensis]GII38595.1 hypothetical protein Pph01_35980 [Planotetraspora phitsanulokensis]